MKLDEPSREPIRKEVFPKSHLHKFLLSRSKADIRGGAIGRIPSSIAGMEQIVGAGYPKGSVINVVGFPKDGKTTTVAHECIEASAAGHECLMMYNESPMVNYMQDIWRHATDLGYDEKQLENLYFINSHGLSLTSPKYDSIRRMADMWVIAPIKQFLEAGHKPRFIVIDSLTRFYRTWPAQSFEFVKTTVYGLKTLFTEHDVHPAVFTVHQKSSGEEARNDARGFGGWGNIHEMDGSIVLRREMVNFWGNKTHGLAIGSTQRFIRADFRSIPTPELEFHYYQRREVPRKLVVSRPLVDIIAEWEESKARASAGVGGE